MWGQIASAVIGAGGSILGGKAKKDATTRAAEIQRESEGKRREELSPWRRAGEESLERVSAGLRDGEFAMDDFDLALDEGYEFRQQEGQKALTNALSRKGGAGGGRQMKELMRYNQGFASNEFGNAYNREAQNRTNKYNMLNTTSNMGLNAAGQNVSTVGNIANNLSNTAVQRGIDTDNTYGGVATAANQGIENWLLAKNLKKGAPSSKVQKEAS